MNLKGGGTGEHCSGANKIDLYCRYFFVKTFLKILEETLQLALKKFFYINCNVKDFIFSNFSPIIIILSFLKALKIIKTERILY